MELKEMIKVMQHFENGGEVENTSKKGKDNHWATVTSPSWDWAYFDYRIKELKQKVTIERWLCQENQGEFIVMETSNINRYEYHKKIKLLSIYAVEL